MLPLIQIEGFVGSEPPLILQTHSFIPVTEILNSQQEGSWICAGHVLAVERWCNDKLGIAEHTEGEREGEKERQRDTQRDRDREGCWLHGWNKSTDTPSHLLYFRCGWIPLLYRYNGLAKTISIIDQCGTCISMSLIEYRAAITTCKHRLLCTVCLYLFRRMTHADMHVNLNPE